MSQPGCFNARIRLSSHNLEELYSCIRLLAGSLCKEVECSYPDTMAWILASNAKCLIKMTTPQPLQPISGSSLLPALVASIIDISCTGSEDVVTISKYILQVLKECRGIGTALT